MVSQQFSSSRGPLSSEHVVSATLLCAAVLACSGTDVGYPRASAISSCATGGASSDGGTGPGSGASGNVPAQGVGGNVEGSGGSKGPSAGGGAILPGTSSGGANAGGVVNPGGMVGTGGSSASGAPSAGNSGAQSGGAPALGGAPPGGGASAGSASAGAPTTGFVWPAPYDAAAVPATTPEGHHNPGTSCMSSVCHGTKVPFVYGGTVYKADGVTGAANVQVGISDGALTLVTYSAANGNIWLPSSTGMVAWGNAVIAIRNKNGEHVKAAAAPRGAACNGTGCHNSANRLIEP